MEVTLGAQDLGLSLPMTQNQIPEVPPETNLREKITFVKPQDIPEQEMTWTRNVKTQVKRWPSFTEDFRESTRQKGTLDVPGGRPCPLRRDVSPFRGSRWVSLSLSKSSLGFVLLGEAGRDP